MDWFLYDRDLRHERVKEWRLLEGNALKIGRAYFKIWSFYIEFQNFVIVSF